MLALLSSTFAQVYHKAQVEDAIGRLFRKDGYNNHIFQDRLAKKLNGNFQWNVLRNFLEI